MNKRNLVMSILLGSVLIAGLFSITYAYFAINQSNTSSNVTIVTGNTTLVLDDVDPITKEDKISPNNTSITRYLTIRNEGSVDGYAKLLFKDLVNTFVLDDLTYTLEEVNSDKTSLSSPNIIVDTMIVPKSAVAANTELADGLLIPSNTSKYYKLTVSYDYKTDENQDADLNKVLTSGFIIEEGSIIIRTTNGIEMKLASSNINSVIPSNNSLEKSFTLTNTTNETQTVNVELVNITNSNENLTADLSKGGTKLVENKSIPVGTNETVVLKNGLEIPANDNSDYTIIFNNTSSTNSNISASINTKGTTQIYCVDESGNEIDCPTTFTMGDRIAIGRDIPQYFRYLRTTDTTSMLNECGKVSSVSCTDTSNNQDSVIVVGSGYMRLIAEHNLEAAGDKNYSSTTAIYEDALQDLSDNYNSYQVVFYNENDDDPRYSSSTLKKYITNYGNHLNSIYFGNKNIIIGNILTYSEARNIGWECPSGYASSSCPKAPKWIKNTIFWLGSPVKKFNTTFAVWQLHMGSIYGYNDYHGVGGVRPVIMISETDFNRLAR